MGNEAICSEKAKLIKQGRTSLGIEFGSTRIKAVLVDFSGEVLGVGFHDWANSLKDGVWTYPLEEIHAGLKKCYTSLRKNVCILLRLLQNQALPHSPSYQALPDKCGL